MAEFLAHAHTAGRIQARPVTLHKSCSKVIFKEARQRIAMVASCQTQCPAAWAVGMRSRWEDNAVVSECVPLCLPTHCGAFWNLLVSLYRKSIQEA